MSLALSSSSAARAIDLIDRSKVSLAPTSALLALMRWELDQSASMGSDSPFFVKDLTSSFLKDLISSARFSNQKRSARQMSILLGGVIQVTRQPVLSQSRG